MNTPIILENKEFYEKEKYFSQFGSALNLFQFFFSEIPESDYDFSSFVAKEAIKSCTKRNAEIYENIDKRYQSRFYLNLGYYGPEMNADINGEPKGEKISLSEFLGESYSLKLKEITHQPQNGLAYALLQPPYNLNFDEFIRQEAREFGRKKLRNWEQKRLVLTLFFKHFLKEIELDTEADLTIYTWNDDWSDYFEPGKEWWGNFFWTILNKSKGTITVICASTTD